MKLCVWILDFYSIAGTVDFTGKLHVLSYGTRLSSLNRKNNQPQKHNIIKIKYFGDKNIMLGVSVQS